MTEQVEHGFAQVAILLAAELAVETAFSYYWQGWLG